MVTRLNSENKLENALIIETTEPLCTIELEGIA